MKTCFLIVAIWSGLIYSNPLEEALSAYVRPVTVLELGTRFGQEIAVKYPDSVFITMDDHPIDSTQPYPSNFIHLSTCATFDVIQALKECEHFDLIYTSSNDQQMIDCMKEMTHTLLIQKEGLIEKLVQTSPFFLKKTTLIHPDYKDRIHQIDCDYSQKIFTKLQKETLKLESIVSWIPGINLLTYLAYGGDVPSKKQVALKMPFEVTHSDWMPNNMILGSVVSMIDFEDQKYLGKKTSLWKKQRVVQFLLSAPSGVEKLKDYFFYFLVHIDEPSIGG